MLHSYVYLLDFWLFSELHCIWNVNIYWFYVEIIIICAQFTLNINHTFIHRIQICHITYTDLLTSNQFYLALACVLALFINLLKGKKMCDANRNRFHMCQSKIHKHFGFFNQSFVACINLKLNAFRSNCMWHAHKPGLHTSVNCNALHGIAFRFNHRHDCCWRCYFCLCHCHFSYYYNRYGWAFA